MAAELSGMPLFEIEGIHISIGEKEIVKGVSLAIRAGEKHALMGPNGSGKSTLANALMGHPSYRITSGRIRLKGEDITDLEPDEKARKGMFLAFQYPVAVPGVSVANFLRSAVKARSGSEVSAKDFRKNLKEQMNVTTTMVEFGIDELKLAGLTAEPSTMVKPPRVKESPVALECKYWRTIELPVEKGHEAKRGSVVFGQVVGVHIDDGIIKDGRIDTLALKPVARLGYSEYTTTDNVWRMRRPDDPKYQ